MTFHVEVAVPPGLRARTTSLYDDANGSVLAAGARDADRPAIYYAADTARELVRPVLVVAYGAERWRFLGPAALVAAVITLLDREGRAVASTSKLGEPDPEFLAALAGQFRQQ